MSKSRLLFFGLCSNLDYTNFVVTVIKMDKNSLKLSVVIPCYNEFGTLEQVIEAVKNSPVENCEIIVVDDCSTDGTTELLRSQLEAKVDRVI